MKFRRKNNGFTMIELLYSLLITGTITLIGYSIFDDISTKNRLNGDIDSISANENMAVKFIMDQNKTIINQMKSENADFYASPLSKLGTKYPNYSIPYANRFAPSAFSDPCFVITRDSSNEVLKAYLVWNNIAKANNGNYKVKNLNYIIEHQFATNLVNSKSPLLLQQTNINKNTSPTILDAIQSSDIANFKGCNYTLNSNSIFLDLTKNKNFQMVRDLTTDNTGNLDVTKTSEALTNTGNGSTDSNQTLTTNLYLDSIVKESEPWEKDICQPTESLNITEADTNCRNLGTMYKEYDGQPSWGANFSDIGNNRCKYQPTGFFKGVSYKCDTNFLNGKHNAGDKCLSQSNHYSAKGSLSGAYYSGVKYYSWNWTNVDKKDPNCRGQYSCNYDDQICNVSLQPLSDEFCRQAKNAGCKDSCDSMMNQYPSYVNVHYNSATNKCDLSMGNFHCQKGGKKIPTANVSVGVRGGSIITISPSFWTSYYTSDKVYSVSQKENCTAVVKPKVHLSGITPPKHQYQSLKFGSAEVKTTNPDGTEVIDAPAINVGNSGVKTGFVFIRSKNLVADTPCTKEELGKIYQQTGLSDNYTGSQIVCNYDPNYCGGDGYCYSPLVSDSTIVKGPSRDLNCPAGTIVSKSYTINNYGTNTPISDQCKNYKSNGAKFYGVNLIQIAPPPFRVSPCPATLQMDSIRCVNTGEGQSFNNCKGGQDGKVVCN